MALGRTLVCIACSLIFSTQVAAQTVDADNTVIVSGEREKTAKTRVEALTRAITRKPRTDKPLARQYDPICVGVIGLSPAYAEVLIERIEANARRLGIAIAKPDCRVNTLVAFVLDSRSEVETLRQDSPWLFANLRDYEYDRILRGREGARAWQGTLVREIDGKDFKKLKGICPPTLCPIEREMDVADPFKATRFGQQIRTDMTGSVVIFDNDMVPGKSLQQLADYASMRSFAAVDDFANDEPNTLPTILSLFSDVANAPETMTDFDWSYLEALYKLPRNANGSAIHDAAWSAYREKVLRKPD